MRILTALILLLFGRRRRQPPPTVRLPPRREEPGPSVTAWRHVPRNPRAEVVVAVCLLLAGACATAFVLFYVLVGGSRSTLWLGLSLGLGFAFLAAALIVAGNFVVPQEKAVEERAQFGQPEEVSAVTQEIKSGTEGISRRRLIVGAAGVASVGVGAALVVPLASLGPNVDERIDDTPWHSGVPVVDEQGNPVLADDIVEGTFTNGFARGASLRNMGNPIIIVRLDPIKIHLPPNRRPQSAWAPEGILAYSKICTHAGCAISLYRKPTFPDTQPRPAFVCPCHYSTFDPARGAMRIFGPAGRPLPQLPLRIHPLTRQLVANGGFSGSIGPAWFNVKRNG